MNYSATGEQLTDIADAIRTKTNRTDPLAFPTDFVSDISDIVTAREVGLIRVHDRKTVNFNATGISANTSITTTLTVSQMSTAVGTYVKCISVTLNNVPTGVEVESISMSKTANSSYIYAQIKLLNTTSQTVSITANSSATMDFEYYRQ